MMMVTPTGADASSVECDGAYTVSTIDLLSGYSAYLESGEATHDVTANGVEFRHTEDIVIAYQKFGEFFPEFRMLYPSAYCQDAVEQVTTTTTTAPLQVEVVKNVAPAPQPEPEPEPYRIRRIGRIYPI
jgi:hypothetical protein